MKIRSSAFSIILVFTTFIGAAVRAADAPGITSPLTATTSTGEAFSYPITATNSPTSYFASPLPTGLSIDRFTGLISGSPTKGGTTKVVLGATNANGTGIATLTLTVNSTDVGVITNDPLFAAGTVGSRFGFVLTSSGGEGASYTATGLPPGLSLAPPTGNISGIPTEVGTTVVPVTLASASGSSLVFLTIAIGAPGAPLPEYIPGPEIKSATAAAARVGTAFSYTITATNSPTSYSATGLPAGLAFNPFTGAITGTPTVAGAFDVVLTATNATATTAITLTITVAPPLVVAPVITGPSTASATAGAVFPTVQIIATGVPTSYAATGLPAGLSLNATTGTITGTATTAGTYVATISATNSAGTATTQLTITIAPAPVPPTITSATNITATLGQPLPTYVITATAQPTGFVAVGLPPGLSFNTTTGAIAGTPTVAGTFTVTIGATNNVGTTNGTLIITVTGSRIVNFSARALSGAGDQALVMGFVVAGNGKNVLVRGVGPGLAQYGVANALADPLLTVFSGSANTTTATNDDWQVTTAGQATAEVIAATATRVGAFALPNGSKDSALITILNNGSHTTSMVRANATTGVALTEIYDLDTTGDSRLINVSARMNVSAGEGALIAGLAIAGNAPKTVLIRGVGPSLAVFGVTGVLADPTITVFNGSTAVATNDNWEAGGNVATQISVAAAQVGAFALTAGSRDAALLVTLQPGSYTVQITGVGNGAGVALIEIYDAQ